MPDDKKKLEATPERKAKFGGVKKVGGTYRVESECKLDVYFNKGWVNYPEWVAGSHLFLDYVRTSHYQSLGMDYSSPMVDSSPDHGHVADSQVWALKRYDKAIEALGVPNYKAVVKEVCLYDRGLNDINERLNTDWPPGVPLHNLKCGLDELVKHYGLENIEPLTKRKRKD